MSNVISLDEKLEEKRLKLSLEEYLKASMEYFLQEYDFPKGLAVEHASLKLDVLFNWNSDHNSNNG